MSWTVSDLVGQLSADPWRRDNPFSDDISQCHDVVFDVRKSRRAKTDALSDWLATNQPCLFGQMEAKQRRLPLCLLTDNDLERSDEHIRAKIAEERRGWKRRAVVGKSHGFLISVLSERVAFARPDGPGGTLHTLAARLCELYLGLFLADEVLCDDVLLEIPTGSGLEIRKWKVGVNLFASQGDGRWWRDHRIPGGLAFSMNSVGHMARHKVETMAAKGATLPVQFTDFPRERLVNFALLTAMRTIGPPCNGSTRGTWLAEHGSFEEDKSPPPYDERTKHFREMAAFSENRYRGHYHTDHTIPTDYFREDLWRSEDLTVRDDLYFTYLHSKADSDYLCMGLGEVIDSEENLSSSRQPPRSDS